MERLQSELHDIQAQLAKYSENDPQRVQAMRAWLFLPLACLQMCA
jgi:hypothetical protein